MKVSPSFFKCWHSFLKDILQLLVNCQFEVVSINKENAIAEKMLGPSLAMSAIDSKYENRSLYSKGNTLGSINTRVFIFSVGKCHTCKRHTKLSLA